MTTSPRATVHLLLAALLLVSSSAAFAKGRLGFGVQVATDGMLSTTIKEVKVASVRPDSPAEKAGLRADDIVTELAGRPVVGSKGGELKTILADVKQGEHLKLLVLRAGKPLTIDIVAGPDQ